MLSPGNIVIGLGVGSHGMSILICLTSLWSSVLYPGAESVKTKRHAKVLYNVVVLARDAAAAKGSRRCQAAANALVLIYHSIR